MQQAVSEWLVVKVKCQISSDGGVILQIALYYGCR